MYVENLIFLKKQGVFDWYSIFLKVGEKALEEILADPEVIAQLDWLWSNKINNETSIVELSRQVDKGCVEDELKPIQK